MGNPIYSFFAETQDNQHVRERLRDHVGEALKIVENMEHSSIGRYAYGILPGLRGLHELVRLTVVFHDVGKAFYQARIPANPRPGYTLSFVGHEFLSTYVFRLAAGENRKFLTDHYGVQASLPISFAILFHHHAMNAASRARRGPGKTLGVDGAKLSALAADLQEELGGFLDGEEKDALKAALGEAAKRLGKTDITTMFRDIANRELQHVWREWVDAPPQTKKLALILLSTLVVADVLAAERTRPPSESTYKNVLREFADLYLKPVGELGSG